MVFNRECKVQPYKCILRIACRYIGLASYLGNGQLATDHCYHYGYLLVGLIVIVESYLGEISSVLTVGIWSYYARQERLMKERAVGIVGI